MLTPVLTISNVTGLNNYQYRCVVVGISSSVNSDAAALTVSPLPVPMLAGNFGGTLTCAQTSLTLTASGGVSYTFANGSGTLGTPGSTNTLVISAPGMYSVTAANASGCAATASIAISEDKNAPTMPTLTASTTLTCAQPSLTLTAATTGTGLSYAFNGPGGSLSGIGNSRTISVAGTYSVTVTGANGCTISQSTTFFGNTTAPVATLTTSSTAVCAPASITLTAGGGVSYTFSMGATQIGSSNQAVVAQSVTVASANGCTSTTSTVVTVNLLPNAPSLTGEGRSVTQSNTPRSLLDFVTADNGNTLSFSGLSGLIDPPTVPVSQTGVQNFRLPKLTPAAASVWPRPLA